MTRSEWIQQALLTCGFANGNWESKIESVVQGADYLERSGAAPWTSQHGPLNAWNAGSLSGLSDRQLEAVSDQIRNAETACERRLKAAHSDSVVAATESEREACARIADRNDMSAYGIAREIRARGGR